MEKGKVAKKGPFVLEVEAGVYAWCSCGKSENQPYCDGSHKDTGLRPIIEKLEAPKKANWCGCKQSKNPPYCDGSHNTL